MATKPQYFVLAISLWQGNTWKPIAGPFNTRAEAEAAAEKHSHNGWSEPQWSEAHQAYWAPTQNLGHVVRTLVASKTEMKREFGWSYDDAIERIEYYSSNKD